MSHRTQKQRGGDVREHHVKQKHGNVSENQSVLTLFDVKKFGFCGFRFVSGR